MRNARDKVSPGQNEVAIDVYRGVWTGIIATVGVFASNRKVVVLRGYPCVCIEDTEAGRTRRHSGLGYPQRLAAKVAPRTLRTRDVRPGLVIGAGCRLSGS